LYYELDNFNRNACSGSDHCSVSSAGHKKLENQEDERHIAADVFDYGNRRGFVALIRLAYKRHTPDNREHNHAQSDNINAFLKAEI